MKQQIAVSVGSLWIAVALAGCPVSLPSGLACDDTHGCAPGQACVAGLCTSGDAARIDSGVIDGGSPTDAAADAADGGVPPRDAGPPPSDAGAIAVEQLDLLLMIDDSNSMAEEQDSVVAAIPRMIQMLTHGDADNDGTEDFIPISSLHVGIVTSDMGLGDAMPIAACPPGTGDDGLMTVAARVATAGCEADYAATYPQHMFDFSASGGPTALDVAGAVACVSRVGTAGCGFEFELDAPLKALSLTPVAGSGGSPVSWTAPGYAPPTFWGPSGTTTPGHGSDPLTNGAFLRPASILAIVTINDEDDCSTPNYQIFDRANPAYAAIDLNLRCHALASELYPVQRYVDGFLGLRATPDRLVFASITGVPPDLGGMAPTTILGDARMVETVDTAMMRLVPACVSPGTRGVAFPAVRMTQVAEGIAAEGGHVTVQSICQADYTTAFDAIVHQIAVVGP